MDADEIGKFIYLIYIVGIILIIILGMQELLHKII